MKKIIVALALTSIAFGSFGQAKQAIKKTSTTPKSVASKFGALAVDRRNGFYYGFAFDQPSLPDAEDRAVKECNAKGGNCTIVLSYSGSGCAAYRTITGNVGTAFGWGLSKTKEEADATAIKECNKRSNGINPTNFVWSCNASNEGKLNEIYNASDEIEAPVKVGNQIWSNKNLDVSIFRNGEAIPEAKNAIEWQQFCINKKAAFIYLNFDPANGKKLGKLYNFYAVKDSRGLAPKGWHVPSVNEYERLIEYLGGSYEAGKKIRATTGWEIPNGLIKVANGTNESGLSFLPGGRAMTSEYEKAPTFSTVFLKNYNNGSWWTSTVDETTTFNGFTASVGERAGTSGSESPERGFSVRLIKD